MRKEERKQALSIKVYVGIITIEIMFKKKKRKK